jgi:hypothetical protein
VPHDGGPVMGEPCGRPDPGPGRHLPRRHDGAGEGRYPARGLAPASRSWLAVAALASRRPSP